MANDESNTKPTPTLWTAPAPTGRPPLPEARLDPNASRDRIEAALKEAKKRAAAFSNSITQDMLSKRY